MQLNISSAGTHYFKLMPIIIFNTVWKSCRYLATKVTPINNNILWAYWYPQFLFMGLKVSGEASPSPSWWISVTCSSSPRHQLSPHTLSSLSPLLDSDTVNLDKLLSSHPYSPVISGTPIVKHIQRVVGFRNTELKSQGPVISEAKGWISPLKWETSPVSALQTLFFLFPWEMTLAASAMHG